ncbi:hypothetical protein UlMin_023960 [Ulmus minor]
MELDELVLVVARTSVYYHNNFLVKQPCRNSPHTGWKFVKGILEGMINLVMRFFKWKNMLFSNYCPISFFVLEKMMMLAFDEIKPPKNYDLIQHYIQSNCKYGPYFKDCIGAIDGTHIHAKIPVNEQIPCIGRKGFSTQNIMAACNFNMLFTFVWPRWEGNKYYLVDVGYPNMKGFLAPYKEELYNLPGFFVVVVSQKENEKHLIMCIHHCKVQVAIVTAFMAFHDFIRREAIADIEFESHEENEDHV